MTMRKSVGWLVFAIGALLLGVLWWVYIQRDAVVGAAIRKYGAQITGVEVQLDAVHIDPVGGHATLRGLSLGNPAGFKTARAFYVDEVTMELDVASLAKDVILIHKLNIENPQITYEYASGGSNLDILQRRVQAYVRAHVDDSSDQAPKKFIVEHLVINDAKAQVSAKVLQGQVVRLDLARVHLKNVGKNTQGVTAAELANRVVSALTRNTNKAVSVLDLGGAWKGVKQGADTVARSVQGWFK